MQLGWRRWRCCLDEQIVIQEMTMRKYPLQLNILLLFGFVCTGLVFPACDDGNAEMLAEEVCKKQIECEVQLLEQSECVSSYVDTLDESTLESCKTCQSDKSCEDLSGGACLSDCF